MPKDGAPDRVSSWYSSYVLLLVGLVSVANYYDRTLISILVEPIKGDLGLSDGQIGLLSGVGVAVMYSLLGVPMARLADRFGRARVLGSVVAVWSVMTVLSGRTVNFTTMLLARAGVGVGEAGGLPAAHALIADYFSPRFRGKALSVIGVCGGLGLSLAYAGGGLINDWQGWRMAFYLGGLPGLVLSVLVFLTIREPTRSAGAGGTAPNVTFRQAAATLWRRKSYVLLCIGLGVGAIGSYGQSAWTPAFLMRAYHLSASEVGGYYSAVSGPATMVSILLGGLANDWLVARDKRWPLWLLALTFGLSVPFSLVFFLERDFALGMGMTMVTTVAGGLWVGPSYALVQNLAGPPLRAVGAAVFMMTVNIVGLSLGPYLTGLFSDLLTPSFGNEALTVSLCLVTLTCLVGAACFLAATRTVIADIAEADAT